MSGRARQLKKDGFNFDMGPTFYSMPDVIERFLKILVIRSVIFLRDIKENINDLGRSYFPDIEGIYFSELQKQEIIRDIENDFYLAFQGIKKLPVEGRLGVYIAYKYYLTLLKKLKRRNSPEIYKNRVRISDPAKAIIFFKSFIRYQLNIL